MNFDGLMRMMGRSPSSDSGHDNRQGYQEAAADSDSGHYDHGSSDSLDYPNEEEGQEGNDTTASLRGQYGRAKVIEGAPLFDGPTLATAFVGALVVGAGILWLWPNKAE